MNAPDKSTGSRDSGSKPLQPYIREWFSQPSNTMPDICTVSADDLSESVKESVNNFNAAVARTLTRGLALYFSRPVRLFRPAKGA
jgi:hypothetical protein